MQKKNKPIKCIWCRRRTATRKNWRTIDEICGSYCECDVCFELDTNYLLNKYRKETSKEVKCKFCGEPQEDSCDHEFYSVKGWENRHEIGGMGETLEKQVVCKHCGKKAREIWIYSCTLDENDQPC